VDSYHYYGTDDLYLGCFHKFVRVGAEIGIAVPGLYRDFPGTALPHHLTRKQKNGAVFWEWDSVSFHTAAWWRLSSRRRDGAGWQHTRWYRVELVGLLGRFLVTRTEEEQYRSQCDQAEPDSPGDQGSGFVQRPEDPQFVADQLQNARYQAHQHQ
jgi:hypothetical protein